MNKSNYINKQINIYLPDIYIYEEELRGRTKAQLMLAGELLARY